MTRARLPALLPLALGTVLATGCASLAPPPVAYTASAELRDPSGQVVGTATFSQVGNDVRVVLTVRGLRPGTSAVHIHEVGRCDPPGFTSAGGHFNPQQRQHGLLNPDGPHAGDLPNLTVDTDGTGRLETTSERFSLDAAPTSLLDADGSALVIHGAPDDFKTDPTGNSGARIACGVIVKDPA
jgi:Cu-Zn family superoxide dismutase